MTRALIISLTLALLTAGAHSVAAQEFSIDIEAGYADMTSASSSAKAVFGSSGAAVFGAGIGYALESGVFFRGGLRRSKREGERVFAVDETSTVFALGHPLEVTLTPIFGTLGYRFVSDGAMTPYLGLGAGVTRYKETSTVAGITESLDESAFSYRGLGGIEFLRGPVRVAVEVAWSSAPNVLGQGGLSEVFGETDAGGLSVVGKIVFVP
jgi:opacity protein-like surface antigen